MFIEAVLRGLPEFSSFDDYKSVENRKRVGRHLRYERDPKKALLCKQRDGYRCQVCNFHFEEHYGHIGKTFAEAHHLIPLAKLEREMETSAADLTTVCANCHRMLHKLSGEASDIEKLRKLILFRGA